jgi:hypothetical protein
VAAVVATPLLLQVAVVAQVDLEQHQVLQLRLDLPLPLLLALAVLRVVVAAAVQMAGRDQTLFSPQSLQLAVVTVRGINKEVEMAAQVVVHQGLILQAPQIMLVVQAHQVKVVTEELRVDFPVLEAAAQVVLVKILRAVVQTVRVGRVLHHPLLGHL